MKRKILLVFLFGLFLCGCDAQYTATVDSNGIHEKTFLVGGNSERYQSISLDDFLKGFDEANIPLYFNPDNYDEENENRQAGVDYYEFDYSDGLIVDGSFNLSEIYRSRAVKMCFDELSVQRDGNTYRISAINGCRAFKDYPLLQHLKIDLDIKYDVISSNADLVNGTHYIWNIDKNNSADKRISVVFSTQDIKNINNDYDEESNGQSNESQYNWANEHPLLLILITFASLFVGLGIVLFVYRKMR